MCQRISSSNRARQAESHKPCIQASSRVSGSPCAHLSNRIMRLFGNDLVLARFRVFESRESRFQFFRPDKWSFYWVAGILWAIFQQDVEAGIQLSKASSNPGAPPTVYGYARSEVGIFSNYQTLGNIPVGQTVKPRLKWDQPANQFTFQLNGNPEVKIQPTITEHSPALNGTKGFWVGRGVPGCSTVPIGSAMMDAYFDNAYVNPF